jgi:hypothetical protein
MNETGLETDFDTDMAIRLSTGAYCFFNGSPDRKYLYQSPMSMALMN